MGGACFSWAFRQWRGGFPSAAQTMLRFRAALLQKSLRQVGDLMPQVLVLDLKIFRVMDIWQTMAIILAG